ncbi:hypothetical protein [Chishuiella changwenlii]|jgi:hypothetical protein|uniref:hypothetical protein n=1 Tax=Chishuiella changwenlii TaxID=1434701 RepID=UPI002FD8A7D2
MKKNYFFSFSFILFLFCFSCKKNEESGNVNDKITTEKDKIFTGEDKIIAEKVDLLYQNYGKEGLSSEPIYSKPIIKDLFNTDLEKDLNKVKEITEINRKKIENSANPTDKPFILEGATFTSLYEGYTSYKIKGIEYTENVNPVGSAALVTVQLENSKVTPQAAWMDTIYFVKPLNNGWKIDNIVFDNKLSGVKDLKTNLNIFILQNNQL